MQGHGDRNGAIDRQAFRPSVSASNASASKAHEGRCVKKGASGLTGPEHRRHCAGRGPGPSRGTLLTVQSQHECSPHPHTSAMLRINLNAAASAWRTTEPAAAQ